jgi:hypothetical protein
LEVEFNSDKSDFLQKEQNRKIKKKEDIIMLSKSKSLEKHFSMVIPKLSLLSLLNYEEIEHRSIVQPNFVKLFL